MNGEQRMEALREALEDEYNNSLRSKSVTYKEWLQDYLLGSLSEIERLRKQVAGFIADQNAIQPASPNSSRTQLFDELGTVREECEALKGVLLMIKNVVQGVLP